MRKLTHLDLFSGIGGFALAVDQVWPGSTHIFVDNDPFCQQVLKKHWPNSKIYGDIRTITADAQHNGGIASKTAGEDSGSQPKSKTGAELPKPESQGVSGVWPEKIGRNTVAANAIGSDGGREDSGRTENQGRETSKIGGESIQPKDGKARPNNTEPSRIRDVADTKSGKSGESKTRDWWKNFGGRGEKRIDILTGGFPCQPFSQAGRRRGTEDDRFLWPEMLRVIRLTKPTWVIAENVRGLLTIESGMVFEQVCLDLEASGYEVQPFIIPAVAINAPHRRDRVWFIAHGKSFRDGGEPNEECSIQERELEQDKPEGGQIRSESERCIGDYSNSSRSGLERIGGQKKGSARIAANNAGVVGSWGKSEGDKGRQSQKETGNGDCDVTNTKIKRLERRSWSREKELFSDTRYNRGASESWNQNWVEAATELCSVDDGLPVELDGFKLSKSQHRNQQLKAYGNSIVPAVAVQIMQAIRDSETQNSPVHRTTTRHSNEMGSGESLGQ